MKFYLLQPSLYPSILFLGFFLLSVSLLVLLLTPPPSTVVMIVFYFIALFDLFLFRHFKSSVLSYLLPGNSHVVLDISKHSRLDEVSSVCCRSSSTHQLGSLSLPTADVAQNLVELLLIHLDRSSQGATAMKTPCQSI